MLLTIAVIGVAGFLLLRDDEGTVAATPSPPPSVPIAVEPNTVVELDPSSGKVLASFDVGVDPDGVALAGDDVWVLNTDAGTVSRVDLRRVATSRPSTRCPRYTVWRPRTRTASGSRAMQPPAVKRLAVEGFSGSPAVPMRPEVDALGLGGGYLWVVKPPPRRGSRRP